jgi:hypothetical protein
MARSESSAQEVAEAASTLRQLPGEIGAALKKAEQDVAATLQPPVFERLEEFMPAADLFFGGTMLLIIVLIHATGVRLVTTHFERRMRALRARPSTWKPDMHMLGAVVLLLAVHLLEIYIWAAALVGFGLVPSWRVAGFVASNTYTAVGYGEFLVPPGWQMLQPFLALSGLFTIGWSVSVLVEVVRRCQEVKSAALRARTAPPHDDPAPHG